MNRTRYYPAIFFPILIFICSCTPVQITKTVYASIEKQSQERTVSYELPKVTPAPETSQMQSKGDITISKEVRPFELAKMVRTNEKTVPSDNPEFDNFEIESTPYFTIGPDRVEFKLRVKNGQSRILKLRDVAIVFLVDGVQSNVDADDFNDWMQGMIIPGSEKSFVLPGPALSSLPDSCVLGMFLYDMPVKYDKAGNVTKKDNYEWYFYFTKKSESKTTTVTYTYDKRPVHKESCNHCNANGHLLVRCERCSGSGKVKKRDGTIIKHYSCNGTGKVKKDCEYCVGGTISHRKSSDPQIAEKWVGYKLRVETIPPGAQILVFEPEQEKKVKVGISNMEVDWWVASTKMASGKGWPITVISNGVRCSVMGDDGKKAIPKVLVDFSFDPPKVIKGRDVTEAGGKLSPEQRDAQKYWILGWEAIESGDYSRGIELSQKSLAFYEFGVVHTNIGYAYLKLGKDSEAESAYQKGFDILSHDPKGARYLDGIIPELEKIVSESAPDSIANEILETARALRKQL